MKSQHEKKGKLSFGKRLVVGFTAVAAIGIPAAAIAAPLITSITNAPTASADPVIRTPAMPDGTGTAAKPNGDWWIKEVCTVTNISPEDAKKMPPAPQGKFGIYAPGDEVGPQQACWEQGHKGPIPANWNTKKFLPYLDNGKVVKDPEKTYQTRFLPFGPDSIRCLAAPHIGC